MVDNDLFTTEMFSTINTSFSGSGERRPLIASSTDSGRQQLPLMTKVSVSFLCISTFFNSISYVIISSVLTASCVDVLHWPERSALAISLAFQTMTYVSAIVGGVLADVRCGCYSVTFAGCCVQMLGQVITYVSYVLVVQEVQYFHWIRDAHLIGVMLIALGQGLINVALVQLGMRHMCTSDVTETISTSRQQTFLLWYMASYQVGMIMAAVFYVEFDWLNTLLTERSVRQMLLSSLPLWCSGIAAFIFIIGKRTYLSDNIAVGRRRLYAFLHALLLRWTVNGPRGRRTYERALMRLIGLQLLAFSILSAYLTIFFQGDTTYNNQTRYATNETGFTYLSIYQPVFSIATIILLAIFGKLALNLRHWHRVVVGMAFAAVSIACAALTQKFLKNLRYDIAGGANWLIPQYATLGISEALYFIGGYEICYAISEKGLEAFTTGLFLGVGSVFGMFLYLAFAILGMDAYFKLFLSLLGIEVVTIGLFVFVMRRIEETKKNMPKDPAEATGATPVPSDTDDSQYRPPAIWDNF